jgi:thiamine pyrophosphate-dependent acetolactate synthase large subunit-like protein
VERDSQHTELMSLAVKQAILNRDVSHLTFPDQVQNIEATQQEAQTPENRLADLRIAPPQEALQKAIGMLKKAKRPVIIVGHGARKHMEDIIALAEALETPVLTTFKGKGLIPDTHPLGCGVLGRSGTPIASYFMNESDLLLVIGASFSNHTGITPKKPTIQIDFDPLALSKFHKIDAPVMGEISVTVKMLREKAAELAAGNENQQSEVASRWKIWRAEKQKRLKEKRGKGLGSPVIYDALTKHAPENAVICVDVGNNAYSLGRYFETTNQAFLMSGYLGSIGFAFPASMGAWAAVGDSRPVIAVAGDGGFCQYMAEVTTAVKHQMPIKVVLLNNNELGKISKEQRSGGWEKWATDLVNPDFAAYAQSCGALGIRVTEENKLEEALKELFAHQGPALLEIKSDVKLV